jgi:hypothetical protein
MVTQSMIQSYHVPSREQTSLFFPGKRFILLAGQYVPCQTISQSNARGRLGGFDSGPSPGNSPSLAPATFADGAEANLK